MQKGLNKVQLIGYLGQSPEIKYSKSNICIATLSLATGEAWRDKQTNEMRETTEWHRIVIFGKLAEIAGEYLRKGSLVYIEGQLRTRKWFDDKSNQERYTTEVVVSVTGTMQMLGERNQNTSTNTQPAPKNKKPAMVTAGESDINFDDDIPF